MIMTPITFSNSNSWFSYEIMFKTLLTKNSIGYLDIFCSHWDSKKCTILLITPGPLRLARPPRPICLAWILKNRKRRVSSSGMPLMWPSLWRPCLTKNGHGSPDYKMLFPKRIHISFPTHLLLQLQFENRRSREFIFSIIVNQCKAIFFLLWLKFGKKW